MRDLGAIVLVAIAGCAHGTGDPSVGSGGAGGSGGASESLESGDGGSPMAAGGSSSSSTNSSSATTAVTAATTTTGGGTCDLGDCTTCHQCATAGICSGSYGACMANLDCVNLNNCLTACSAGDQACLDGCESSYPGGAPLLEAASTCVYCQGCYSSCNGAQAGC